MFILKIIRRAVQVTKSRQKLDTVLQSLIDAKYSKKDKLSILAIVKVFWIAALIQLLSWSRNILIKTWITTEMVLYTYSK